MSEVELSPEEVARPALAGSLPRGCPLGSGRSGRSCTIRLDGLVRHDGVMVASAISYSLIFALFPFRSSSSRSAPASAGPNFAGYISHEALTALPAHVVRDPHRAGARPASSRLPDRTRPSRSA